MSSSVYAVFRRTVSPWVFTLNRIIATSQMQATHARKTFPCFDEPALKAVFNVTIVHDRSTTALSNGRDIGPSMMHTFVLSLTAMTDFANIPEQGRRTRSWKAVPSE